MNPSHLSRGSNSMQVNLGTVWIYHARNRVPKVSRVNINRIMREYRKEKKTDLLKDV